MKKILRIDGMHCGHCAEAVENELKAVGGVASVKVRLKKGDAVIKGEAETEALVAAVARAGFKAAEAEGR